MIYLGPTFVILLQLSDLDISPTLIQDFNSKALMCINESSIGSKWCNILPRLIIRVLYLCSIINFILCDLAVALIYCIQLEGQLSDYELACFVSNLAFTINLILFLSKF